MICFRTKVYYENKAVQSRRIRGSAILVSNHTAVYDYAVMLFVFFTRTLRYQMAEVLFRKKVLGPFLKNMGGILVDRDSTNYSFMSESARILEQGGVVGIFPEGRLPREGET
ncbi:MAG: 1-acyl-sn-glycerol-3-phosphate acyltransferase, partial [Clostridia bacterium]|nr:1-acyl-sn-glycerol-3-phosphate acyltransferase [Clostridia bacterium]